MLQIKIKKAIASVWHENMLGYLSKDIICSEKRIVFRERSSLLKLRGTDNVQGQISEVISRQMEPIMFSILPIFFATRAVLKIGEYINNSLHLA